ncbi:MAG: hypothetical protein KDD38_02195 [Bdellovibrionales bacterium]|nr:hypothetical protein [Bdellovibrionales bacterium]
MKSKIVTLALAVIFMSPKLFAGDLEWSGLYRFEGTQLNYPSLDTGSGARKEYAIHNLILRPKIVAADGLYINAQFNIFNSDAYNQLGAYFGDGLGTGTPTSSNDSNTASENLASEQLAVTQFYLTFIQEYGRLIVGRAPLQFGLGITHNAGAGLFDHYSDTRDMVGYKIMMGNFYFFPSYAKINEGGLSSYDDINEWNYQLVYENPDSDASMGVHYQTRKAVNGGNDFPATTVGGVVNGEYNSKNFNVFFKKETDNYNVGFEVAQQGGDTGVLAGVKSMSLGGFAAALEYEWHPKENKKTFGIKAGMATGDDPTTDDSFEGFIFDRNYDVAMFLFNHGMGQSDVLHTALIGRSATSVRDEPDTEAISNVTYISPYMKYKYSDKMSFVGVFTTGMLSDDTVMENTTLTMDTNLGYEFDFSVVYSVSDKITWVNQFGYFAPGDAWKAGTLNYDNDSIYGFVTKAAVSF